MNLYQMMVRTANLALRPTAGCRHLANLLALSQKHCRSTGWPKKVSPKQISGQRYSISISYRYRQRRYRPTSITDNETRPPSVRLALFLHFLPLPQSARLHANSAWRNATGWFKKVSRKQLCGQRSLLYKFISLAGYQVL